MGMVTHYASLVVDGGSFDRYNGVGGLALRTKHCSLVLLHCMEHPRCYPGVVLSHHRSGAMQVVAQRRRHDVAHFCMMSECCSQQAQRWDAQVAPLLVTVVC